MISVCSFYFIINPDLQAFPYLYLQRIYLRHAGWAGMKKRLPPFSGAALLKIQAKVYRAPLITDP